MALDFIFEKKTYNSSKNAPHVRCIAGDSGDRLELIKISFFSLDFGARFGVFGSPGVGPGTSTV